MFPEHKERYLIMKERNMIMKKFNSLKALREFAGLKEKPQKAEKAIKCRKCGAEMKKVGENVWFCDKEKTDAEGNILMKDNKPIICGNTYIKKLK